VFFYITVQRQGPWLVIQALLVAELPIKEKDELDFSSSMCNDSVTYGTNDFVFGANDAAHVVAKTIVADVLALQEVLCNDFTNLFLGFLCEAVSFNIELNNSFV